MSPQILILYKSSLDIYHFLAKYCNLQKNFLFVEDSMAVSISFHIIINRAIADCQIIGYDRLVGIDLLILRTGTIHLFEGNV